ncbi:cytochrome b-c1 complex subunit 6, mitochondrial-like [Plodia interpunctella]|uniref:cytochrome b-c1 complex subunit 6, mitochondrial-like n=1 Tax=Plodia interpunctella TaxID=58824 RepID=UPI0023685DC8|nr:cytochrome b-c1 complex subunit 6, mitochondrial-like [Plodia interpunctella]
MSKPTDKIIPVVKAEEEEAAEEEDLVDPQQELRDACAQKQDAQAQWGVYQECNDRVNSRSNTAETCEQELIDYLYVLDHCVGKEIFKKLK